LVDLIQNQNRVINFAFASDSISIWSGVFFPWTHLQTKRPIITQQGPFKLKSILIYTVKTLLHLTQNATESGTKNRKLQDQEDKNHRWRIKTDQVNTMNDQISS